MTSCCVCPVVSELPVTRSRAGSGEIRRQVEDSAARSVRARAALIQGGGRPAARAGVNRGIIVRLAPVNCGRYCWWRAGQQLHAGSELPSDNNGAAGPLSSSLSPRERASAAHGAAVKLQKNHFNVDVTLTGRPRFYNCLICTY